MCIHRNIFDERRFIRGRLFSQTVNTNCSLTVFIRFSAGLVCCQSSMYPVDRPSVCTS